MATERKSGDRTDAIRLRVRGLTYSAIAEKMGISRQRVQQMTRPPRKVIESLLDRADHRCEKCRIPFGAETPYHVHHKTLRRAVEEYNQPFNLQLLCLNCHLACAEGIGSVGPANTAASKKTYNRSSIEYSGQPDTRPRFDSRARDRGQGIVIPPPILRTLRRANGGALPPLFGVDIEASLAWEAEIPAEDPADLTLNVK